MKALSLTQPWASLCVLTNSVGDAEKQFETRGWKPSKKMLNDIGEEGIIAIHAAKNFPKAARTKACGEGFFVKSLFCGKFAHVDQLPLGAIIGTVEIYRFIPTESIRNAIREKELAFGDYSDGRWAWQFLNPRELKKPIPCIGALSLWQIPVEIERQILEQL